MRAVRPLVSSADGRAASVLIFCWNACRPVVGSISCAALMPDSVGEVRKGFWKSGSSAKIGEPSGF